MSRITLTRELSFAAAWDVAMKRMRAAGRKKWNQEDYNVAAREFDRLWPLEHDLAREEQPK